MTKGFAEQNEPICRFGPGGDFISVWPGKSSDSISSKPNSLNKALGSIAELVALMLGSEPEGISISRAGIQTNARRIFFAKEKLKYASNNKPKAAVNSATTSVTKNDSKFRDEPMLFADDSRISINTGNKPKHRIRTYKRTAKKRSSISIPGQGSLFEVDVKSARTA